MLFGSSDFGKGWEKRNCRCKVNDMILIEKAEFCLCELRKNMYLCKKKENKGMEQIRLIVFDFDGTIGDTRRHIVITMQQTLAKLGLEMQSEAACAATIGLPLAGCFRSLMPQAPDSIIDRCVEVYHRLFERNQKQLTPQAFPRVAQTLEQLRQRDYRMTVATSRGVDSLKDLLTGMDLIHYFDLLLGADSVTKHKPDPEPVLITLEKMHFDASQTLVVGDMPVDIQMGKGAGCLTCGVTYGNATRRELIDAGADYVIDDFADLLMTLDTIS